MDATEDLTQGRKTPVISFPQRIDIPDDIIKSIAREVAPSEVWERMGRARQLEFGRIAAAGAAYAQNLRKDDQSLDLVMGGHSLAMARG